MAPTVEIPEPCSAPKQRKLDDYSVSPDSILGCMMSQDQSLYCEHNTATFNTLNDAVFKDTHATVNVPGVAWQLPTPKPSPEGLLNSEDTVQDMMETLQQIIGDSELTETLDVEPDELKGWENMLLKISTSSCDMNEELNDIFNNDVLAYVEEQLHKEGGLKLPDQLDNIPDGLSTFSLQNQNSDQNYGWPTEPPKQLTPNRSQIEAGQMPPVLGTIKLTHIDVPSTGLNGLTRQHPPVTFNQSCAQAQKQLRALQVSHENSFGGFRQTNQTPQRQQSHVQMVAPGLPDRQLDPVFSVQGNKWESAVETFNQNISDQPSFPADPPLSSCSQGRFALQSHVSDTQRQSWSVEQQQQMSGFQRIPNAGVAVPQNPACSRSMFAASETSRAPFPVQQHLDAPSLGPSSSCMFTNAIPSVSSVNGGHLHQAPSCQRMNHPGHQIPSQSCFYQGLPGGGSVEGMTAIPNHEGATVSCKMTNGLTTNDLLVQPYQNFTEQTQVRNKEKGR